LGAEAASLAYARKKMRWQSAAPPAPTSLGGGSAPLSQAKNADAQAPHRHPPGE